MQVSLIRNEKNLNIYENKKKQHHNTLKADTVVHKRFNSL